MIQFYYTIKFLNMRKIAYGILFFIIGFIGSIIFLLIITNELDVNLGDAFFSLSFVGAILFSIVGIKNADRKDSFYVNSSFTIIGIFLGIFVSSWLANYVYDRYPSFIDQHTYLYFMGLMLIWSAGGLLGHLVGHRHNAINLPQGIQKQSKLSKFFAYYVYLSKRVEGNYIIYEVDTKRYAQLVIVLPLVVMAQYFVGLKYVWVTITVIVLHLAIGGAPRINHSLRAITRKRIIKGNGIVECWYQIK